MARRVTRDRVPERKEIILWTHADKTRHDPPGIIPPGTEFAQMRPKKLRPNFSGKQGAPTTQDLQNIDQFLASLEARTNELLQPQQPSPIKKKTQRRTKRGLLVEKPFLNDRQHRELSGTGLFPIDDEAEARKESQSVETFLRRYKYQRKLSMRCVKIQAFIRMRPRRRAFAKRWTRRNAKRLHHLLGWRAVTQGAKFFAHCHMRRHLRAWRLQTEDQKQQAIVTWAMFKQRLGKENLTVCAVNLFFESSEMPPPPSPTIKAVTVGIQRKIFGVIWRGWRKYLEDQKRAELEVSTVLQRCLRRMGQFGRVVVEMVHLTFHMWARLAKFKKAVRAQNNPPRFGKPQLPEWDAYVTLFTGRRVRARKAEKVGKVAMKRRYHRAWRWVIFNRKRLEDAVVKARARLLEAQVVNILRTWNAHCRQRGRTMRRGAVYFAAWARWAPRKRRLRRTKVRVKDKVNEWACSNGIRTWVRKVHDARVLYAFQLARGLTLQPSPQYERAVPSTIRVCKEDKEPEPYEFDASDADAVARRRHLSAYSAGLLLLNRGPLWYTVKCFTEWRRVIKATVRWRRQRFLYLHSMAKQLQRTVLLAWQGVAKGAAVPCLLPNGSRLSLDPLKPLDRFADTCHKVFVENCQAELLVEDRAMALSFGGGGIDDCHECPVEGIDDDDFFIEDLERRRRALAEHGDVVQSEKLRTAADEGELDAVKSALRSGASVDSRDELGRTALYTSRRPISLPDMLMW